MRRVHYVKKINYPVPLGKKEEIMANEVRPYANKLQTGAKEDMMPVVFANPSDGTLYSLGVVDAVAVLSHLGINDIDTPARHWEILASKEGAVHLADGSDVTIGAKADAAAGTDAGAASLIALFKRFLAKVTAYAADIATLVTNTTGLATAGASLTVLSTKAVKKNAAVPAGAGAGVQVIRAGAGELHSVLVTAAGTADLSIYDHATLGQGTKIGFIPANTVAGTSFIIQGGAMLGIVAGRAANTPAVTVTYIEV
jgi:hypothetical protein